MFCHNCSFEIKDQELTNCPECNCILSLGLSHGDSPEKEKIFQDIENILNNDELSELYEDTASEKIPEKEDPFDLDFDSVNQDGPEIPSKKEKPVIERARASKGIPDTKHFSDGSTLERDKRSTFEDDDETGDEIESKKTSKLKFVLFFIFSLIIAVGAGLLYLKINQPASPAFPKENISIYENKKSFTIKSKEVQPTVETPKTEKVLAIPEQPTIEKTSIVSKKAVAVSNTANLKGNKPDEKIAAKDNSWTTYIPGNQTYYTIQISSLSNKSFARANLKTLKNKQYLAYVLLTRNNDGKTIYKLRIGKYETAKKAKKAAEYFYKKEKMKYIILKSNADINF